MDRPSEWELKPYLRSDVECDEKKIKTKPEATSLTLSIFPVRVIPVCMEMPALSLSLGRAGRKPGGLKGAVGSIPLDPGMRVGFDQPREKNVHICLSLHGKWPIIIFFSLPP